MKRRAAGGVTKTSFPAGGGVSRDFLNAAPAPWQKTPGTAAARQAPAMQERKRTRAKAAFSYYPARGSPMHREPGMEERKHCCSRNK